MISTTPIFSLVITFSSNLELTICIFDEISSVGWAGRLVIFFWKRLVNITLPQTKDFSTGLQVFPSILKFSFGLVTKIKIGSWLKFYLLLLIQFPGERRCTDENRVKWDRILLSTTSEFLHKIVSLSFKFCFLFLTNSLII